MSNNTPIPSDPILPSDFVRIEAAALNELAQRLDGPPMLASFTQAVNLVLRSAITQNRIIVTGIGKSGIIARKIAATLRSTGTPAHYLHPADAIHGDLGMLSHGDTVLALSASGETEADPLPPARPQTPRRQTHQAFCGCANVHPRAGFSDIVLDTSVDTEACPLNLAPTASTTVMLAARRRPRPRS